MPNFIQYAKEVLDIELHEVQKLPQRLNNDFEKACEIAIQTKGKVIISGVGKSGHIGCKLAASLASTGTPSFFVHASEALHGDLGMVSDDDCIVFISYSGRAKEFTTLIPLLKDRQIPIIGITGDKNSPLAQQATCILDIHIEREACPIGLVPTSSTTATLMMGDAFTIAIMRTRGFTPEDFARSHPGGSLGAKLLNRVYHIMRTGDRVPKLTINATVMDAMLELSRTGLGLVPIIDNNNHVLGVFSDGDLRRLLLNKGALEDKIDQTMTRPGYQLFDQLKAVEALNTLLKYNVNAAPVVNKDNMLVGMINIHDLHQAGISE